jgi:hypothetical protein
MTEDNFELRNGWLEADVVMQAVDESPRAKARAAKELAKAQSLGFATVEEWLQASMDAVG